MSRPVGSSAPAPASPARPFRRILLLGTTGVDKRHAYQAAAKAAGQKAVFVDFENDFLIPRSEYELFNFLDSDEATQWRVWREAFAALLATYPPDFPGDLVVSLHGVFIRELFGVRSLVDFQLLKEFKATLIVTLIDDIYTQWHRTEYRAQGLFFKGRPSLGQLMDGRRSEMLVGDLIARNSGANGLTLPHWLLAVRHSAETLGRLLFPASGLLPIYLSHPITDPFKRRAAGDPSGYDDINAFLARVVRLQHENPHIVCFCPLAIDEMPFIRLWEKTTGPEVVFTPAHRWNVRDFFGDQPLLSEDYAEPISMPTPQVAGAQGQVRSDVGVRDFRLVKQSKRLLVFNPWLNGTLSPGADAEMKYAITLRRPVFVYQDPRHDPGGELRRWVGGSAGLLGSNPGASYVASTYFEDLEEALAAVVAP